MTKVYKIEGMDCDSCATMLELDFEDAGIKAKCSYEKEELEVEGADEKKVEEIVKKAGYEIAGDINKLENN